MADILFLVNPLAGAGKARRIDWERVTAVVQGTVQFARTPEEALSLATLFCQSGGRVLVVVGGDGTVHAVLPALVNSPTALALCPIGTSNVLARELGYPLGRRAMAGCLRALEAGTVYRMDVGVANRRPFMLMVSAGFDAYVLARVSDELKRRLGVYAFIWTGLRLLSEYQPAQTRLWLADRQMEMEAVLVVASNTSHYGWFTRLAPQARIDDGMLDVVWLSAGRSWRRRIWRVFVDVLRGVPDRCPHLHFHRTSTLRIECEPAQPAQSDGELEGTTPLQIGVLPGALRVIAASPPAPSRSAV